MSKEAASSGLGFCWDCFCVCCILFVLFGVVSFLVCSLRSMTLPSFSPTWIFGEDLVSNEVFKEINNNLNTGHLG